LRKLFRWGSCQNPSHLERGKSYEKRKFHQFGSYNINNVEKGGHYWKKKNHLEKNRINGTKRKRGTKSIERHRLPGRPGRRTDDTIRKREKKPTEKKFVWRGRRGCGKGGS